MAAETSVGHRWVHMTVERLLEYRKVCARRVPPLQILNRFLNYNFSITVEKLKQADWNGEGLLWERRAKGEGREEVIG